MGVHCYGFTDAKKPWDANLEVQVFEGIGGHGVPGQDNYWMDKTRSPLYDFDAVLDKCHDVGIAVGRGKKLDQRDVNYLLQQLATTGMPKELRLRVKDFLGLPFYFECMD